MTTVDHRNEGMDSPSTLTSVCDDKAVLDEEVISELFGLIRSPEKRRQLINAFDKTGREHLVQLRLAAEQGNNSSYQLRAHSLKGSAATLGVIQLVQLCREIELKESTITPADMHRYFSKLDKAFRQGNNALSAYMQQLHP